MENFADAEQLLPVTSNADVRAKKTTGDTAIIAWSDCAMQVYIVVMFTGRLNHPRRHHVRGLLDPYEVG